jgi:hypothetical protein
VKICKQENITWRLRELIIVSLSISKNFSVNAPNSASETKIPSKTRAGRPHHPPPLFSIEMQYRQFDSEV